MAVGQGICGMQASRWKGSSSALSGNFFAEISGVLRNWGSVLAVACTHWVILGESLFIFGFLLVF